MKKYAYLFLIIFYSMTPAIVSAKDIPIFSAERNISLAFSKCDNSIPIHLIQIDFDNARINWKWENKDAVWCGWGTESLPVKNISYLIKDYSLIIKMIGAYEGAPPEAKFVDAKGNSSKLVSFDKYITGDPVTGATVTIPLKAFFGDNPNFYPANPGQLKILQFGAEYKSVRGKLTISYIGIGKSL